MTERRFLNKHQAAAYVGVGLSFFNANVRALLTQINYAGAAKFDVNELDAYADQIVESHGVPPGAKKPAIPSGLVRRKQNRVDSGESMLSLVKQAQKTK